MPAMDQDDSLKTDFKVAALLRRAGAAGAGAFVTCKGDPDAGAIMVKLAYLDGTACCLGPARDSNGARVFHPVGPSAAWIEPEPGRLTATDAPAERDVDAYLARRRQSDPDLWIIEIESRDGRHFLLEPVVLAKKAN